MGVHYGRQNSTTGTASGLAGATTATTIGVAAWEYCWFSGCPFTVSAAPLIIPTSAIWSHTINSALTCTAQLDPSYGGGGGGNGYGNCGGESCGGCTPGTCEIGPTPILVDTTAEGFRLTSADRGVIFDIYGDGKPVKLSWTAGNSGNAFLALDRNHNGVIDNGKELFGSVTEQPLSGHPNGYLALAEFDKPENGGNSDGIIDSRDQVYSKLLLWIDANHDGISQPNELHSLPELGVFSISFKYRHDRFVDQFGNSFRYKGILNPDSADGESKDGRYTYDVFFVLADTQKTQPQPAAHHSAIQKAPQPDEIVSKADRTLN